MILRDLSILEKTLKDKIKLGLDIGGDDILAEFSSKTKSRNFAFQLALILQKTFFYKLKPFKSLRNLVLSKLNKNQTAKNIFYNLGDKGLKF